MTTIVIELRNEAQYQVHDEIRGSIKVIDGESGSNGGWNNLARIASVAIIDRQLPFEYTIASRSTDVMVPIPPAHAVDSATNVLAEWTVVYDAHNEVACLMLESMTLELHRQFKNYSPYEMLQELRSMFEKQAAVERFDLIQTFHSCKQEEEKSVSQYVLKMKGYVEQLERLGYVLQQDLSVGLVLNGFTNDFAGFVRNYNMHNIWKTIDELHALLIEYKKGLPKKVVTPQVMTIQGGRIQKANKKSQNAKGMGKGKGKVLQGLRGSRKLKQGDLYLYVSNEVRAQVEAIGSFDLVLPNGLVICLDNCHYAPSITRSVVSASCFVENEFVQCFTNFGISVSRNNVLYFNVIPSYGIYEIDMSNHVPNVNSIYNVSNKRVKHNLDSTYLWHCRLAHISKKRKKTNKSFPHRPERATDVLGLIHTDVWGPLRHVSRQGASYFITFTDDYSRYGYIYLLKHKHEVFETFKVFKNEVENQLEKTIKALRSDQGGESISQEFKDYLKACGIVQQLTPPYTPQHNGASERRNRTLLDMVRSMINLTTFPLSFWDYALEAVARILNMVLTKKDTQRKFLLPTGNKIVIASYAEFFEKNLLSQEVSGRAGDLEEIQDEDTPPSEITSEFPMEVEGFEPPQKEEAPVRSKWLFKKKTDMDGNVHTYNARLVANGFTQTYEVDYEETFSPIADIRAIRILIAIAAFYDYEIWQMDVKTAFLNDILMKTSIWCNLKALLILNIPEKYASFKDLFMNPGELHWTAVKTILKYLRNTKDMFLVYGRNPEAELRVECYLDWKSSKQSTTAMSATEAAYIASSEAWMEAVWIRKFISGLGIVPTINEPIRMFCDNSAALHFANEPRVQKGTIHFHRKYHYVRECIKLGELKFLKVHTDDNLADLFTKALSNKKVTQYARSIGLRLASSFM
nr:hypothetical protein [Tanacetum cinerariifolium]